MTPHMLALSLLPEDATLLYLTEFGSVLYGTNTPSSDTDLKGIYLLSIKSALLDQAPETIVHNTSGKDVRNTADDVDITLYSITYYIDLRIKRFKLNMVDNLSAFCSRAISLTAFLLMLLLAMLTLTGALVAAVALWIGSLIWAFVIVGGFYLIAALLFYLLRDRLFTGGMVRTFSRMFFENNSNDTEGDDEED